MSLSPADTQKIKDAYNEWAKKHPTPNIRLPELFDGERYYSPKETAEAIRNETPFGKEVLEIVDMIISNGEATLQEALDDITGKKRLPPPRL
jgi:hypothetical protein